MYTRLASNFVLFFFIFCERENVERKPGKTLNSINFDRNYIFFWVFFVRLKRKPKLTFFQKEKKAFARFYSCLYTSCCVCPVIRHHFVLHTHTHTHMGSILLCTAQSRRGNGGNSLHTLLFVCIFFVKTRWKGKRKKKK